MITLEIYQAKLLTGGRIHLVLKGRDSAKGICLNKDSFFDWIKNKKKIGKKVLFEVE